MAAAVIVDGPALVQVGTGTSEALEDLGYTIDGVQIIENAFTEDVPGDQNGGHSGPPIDVQIFGLMDIVRTDLSKFDTAVLAKLQPRVRGGTAGATPTPGTLMVGDDKHFILKITPTARPRTYNTSMLRDSNEHNKGTKFSVQSLVFNCYGESGTLWS